ncbi:hypothetical protein BJ981_007496 [Sphaerisporangium krabiense]|uniref:Uncharacterized protein n=1 Tax=Sphaerisporangium krabiense TaxID=763782 RepID=A0A7W8ZD72_9ACTN|nr:hypothetical protein [Sphaerisporangium krabiense]
MSAHTRPALRVARVAGTAARAGAAGGNTPWG